MCNIEKKLKLKSVDNETVNPLIDSKTWVYLYITQIIVNFIIKYDYIENIFSGYYSIMFSKLLICALFSRH